mgnify:CR=1 FL=1
MNLSAFRATALVLASVGGLLSACGESSPHASAVSTPPVVPQTPEPGSSLNVEGSAFVLKLADGRVLRGAELVGATMYLALEGEQVAPVRLASIAPDPERPEILRHDFQ